MHDFTNQMQERRSRKIQESEFPRSREFRIPRQTRFPSVPDNLTYFFFHHGHSCRACIDLRIRFAPGSGALLPNEERARTRNKKKWGEAKKNNAREWRSGYADVTEVIDERRWRSARIPRPIFSGETRRRYSATPAIAGARRIFRSLHLWSPQLAISSDGSTRDSRGRAGAISPVRYASMHKWANVH